MDVLQSPEFMHMARHVELLFPRKEAALASRRSDVYSHTPIDLSSLSPRLVW